MTFSSLFEASTGFPPYPYQVRLATSDALPDALEAGTGSGKTAAVFFAWYWRRTQGADAPTRLILCQPMRSLVTQTAGAIRGWLANLSDNNVGVHVLMGGEVDQTWEQEPERPAVIIGTQDQLLSRALMRGYSMSRYKWPVHFAWLNNDCLWVMDEIQLMGVGLSTSAQLDAFRRSLSSTKACRTLWMSATLDPRLLQTVDAHDQRRVVHVVPSQEGGRLEHLSNSRKVLTRAHTALSSTKKADVAKYVAALAEEVSSAHVQGRTLVILNSVARAQQVAKKLKTMGHHVALLHSRYRPADRRAIEQQALSPSFEGVLVATQAVEAGVDISAGVLFAELAPWSSMVQRFGRCNRYAEHHQAQVYWVDLAPTEEASLPYSPQVLDHARQLLQTHTLVGPAHLDKGLPKSANPAMPVIRHSDFIQLFDTTPDLTDRDLDVSRYIRATDERDVQVAWWDFKEAPDPTWRPHRDELCRVHVGKLKKLKSARPWRWDSQDGRWVFCDRPVPGMVLVVPTQAGGYNAEQGWTGDSKHVPSAIPVQRSGQDADRLDPLSTLTAYVGLATHLIDTRDQMRGLLTALSNLDLPSDTLIDAAHWHDVGKAHPAFQAMLTAGLPRDDPRSSQGPWAKSDRKFSGRNPRRFFRHELVSALAWLTVHPQRDLEAYLIAAHHGKVRMSIRARPTEYVAGTVVALGVHEGDQLPEVSLGEGAVCAAQQIELGPYVALGGRGATRSWRERSESVLAQLGPFRLAYLESLVRVADWRASQLRGER